MRLWEHPPTTERRESRAWLALARASLALRRNEHQSAVELLTRAATDLGASAPMEAQIEATLVRAFIASKLEPGSVPALLAEVEPKLEAVEAEDDRACLR